MNVSLTPELEQFVNSQVESGSFSSATEVIANSLKLLKAQTEQCEHELNALRTKIASGIAQLESGAFTTYDEETLDELFDEVRQDVERQLSSQ